MNETEHLQLNAGTDKDLLSTAVTPTGLWGGRTPLPHTSRGVLRPRSLREYYMSYAVAAAQHEKHGDFTAAAENWKAAMAYTGGLDLDWCQSRMVLCLRYAESPDALLVTRDLRRKGEGLVKEKRGRKARL